MLLKIYAGQSLSEGCDIALKSRLYVSGWTLSEMLKNIRKSSSYYGKTALFICYEKEMPVALCLATAYNRKDEKIYELQAFCRKNFRRLGYASLCVKACKMFFGPEAKYVVYPGIENSNVFWNRVEIPRQTTVKFFNYYD